MKKCKECGNDVAKSAETCPNCGATLKKKRKPTSCLAMIVGILVVIAVLVSLGRRSDKSSESGKQASQPATAEPGAGAGARPAQLTEVQGFTWGEDIEGVTQRLGVPAVAGADGKLNIQPIVLNKMSFQRELLYVEKKVVGLQLTNERQVLFRDSIVPLRDALTEKYGKPVEERKIGTTGLWRYEKAGTTVEMQAVDGGAGWATETIIVYQSSAHLAKVEQAEKGKREETRRKLQGDL